MPLVVNVDCDYSVFSQDLEPNGMASRVTILKGRMRLCRSKLGSIFLGLLAIACVLCVLNWFSASVSKKNDGGDFEGGGRKLAALPGGEELIHRHRHGNRHKKHPHENEDTEPLVCQIPKLTLDTDTNKDAYHPMEPLACQQQHLFYIVNSTLRINKTVLGSQKIKKCEYRYIDRVSDSLHTYSTKIMRTEKFQVRVQHDFFRVECYIEGSKKHEQLLMENGRFDSYQRRKLLLLEDLQNMPVKKIVREKPPTPAPFRHGDEVHDNPPKLVGSFGLPDLADNILHKRALKAQVPKANELSKSADEVKKALKQERENRIEKSSKKDTLNAPKYTFDDVQFDLDDSYQYSDDPDLMAPDYDQFVAQIYPKKEVFDRVKGMRVAKNSTQMNVLMFALDSMSHLSYQRKLPLTYRFLKDTLNAVILDAYNIVGDATTAALLPIFTGKAETELPEVRVNKEGSHYVDLLPFIWNKYEQTGYVTLYAEDQPSLGTFQLRFNGFEEKPVDHYIRHFWQAALSSTVHEDSPQYCLGGRTEHQYTLDYVKDLFLKYPTTPKFAFGFLGELSHADNNPAEYIDRDLVSMLKFLKDNGYLDNTLLIVMGDHGARYSKVRYTTQGKLEERLPMMSLTFPQKFKDAHPAMMKNLRNNVDRLTTPFDIHELLKTVINLYNAEKPVKYNDRGISPLNVIPANRTCESAGIDMHWCTCMKYEILDEEDYKVRGVAGFVLEHINNKNMVVQGMCHPLTLKTIRSAWMVFPNEQVLKFLKSIDSDQRVANFSKTIKLDIIHYQLTIETAPNDGLYEATVQVNVNTGKLSVVGEISRINKYGDQPHCVINTHPDLRKFCSCTTKPMPAPKKKSVRKT